MVQWCLDGWFSLGVHVDFRIRQISDGQTYGPYVDLHLGCVIISIGNNPAFSGRLESACSVSRGGVPVD